jgi:hypothetical protein
MGFVRPPTKESFENVKRGEMFVHDLIKDVFIEGVSDFENFSWFLGTNEK